MTWIVMLCFLYRAGVDWEASLDAGKQAYAREDFPEAERQYSRALSFASGDLERAVALANLASAHIQLRHFREADEAFASLQQYRNGVGIDAELAEALLQAAINHGALTYRRGDPARAKEELEAALQGRPTNILKAQIFSHLALIYRDMGVMAKAQTFAEDALKIREAVFGPEAVETAASLSIVSQMLQRQDRNAEAEPLCRRALAIRRKVWGPAHGGVAESLNNLGAILKAEGNYAEAERVYLQAVDIWGGKSPANGYGAALARNNLATLHQAQGKYKKAEEEFLEAASAMERAVGPNHPTLSSVLMNFATLCRTTRKYDEAETLLRRVLAIDERNWGADHPHVAADATALADLAGIRKDYAAAEPLLLRALAIYERAGQPDERSAAAAFRAAMLYQLWEKSERAAPYFQRALESWNVKQQSDLQIARDLETYAAVLRRRQLFAEAESARTLAIGIRVRAAKNGTPNAFPKT